MNALYGVRPRVATTVVLALLLASLAFTGLLAATPPAWAAPAPVSFAAHVDYDLGAVAYSAAVGDFNGDGKADLVTANCDSLLTNKNTVSVLLGTGSGGFAAHVDHAVGSNPWSVAVADFNKDGKADLATANEESSTVSILLGDGSGGFAAHVDHVVGFYPLSVAAGDFNGDGKADLATANYFGGVSVLLGNGNGGFAAHVDYATGASSTSIAVGDFNKDGKVDLAVANAGSDSVSVLLGNGSGGFAAHVDYAVGSHPYSVAVGDFNKDGKADLATANPDSNTVSVLLGNGSSGFAAHVDYGVGTHPDSVAVGDFNGDGRADLVTANQYSVNASILLGNGSGGFAAHVDQAVYDYALAVAVGDFNKDGKADLATANWGSVSVLLNTTPPKIAITAPTATSSWPSGSTHSVTWTVNPACAAVGEFRIWLVSADNLHWYLSKQVLPVAGHTSYSTAVTASVPAGSYKAAVYYRPTLGGAWTATAKSAAFTVTPINITSPTATSSWKTGTTHSVTWTVNPAYAAVGEFRVWLVSADNLHWYLSKQVLPTAGKTSYALSLVASVPAGSYKAAVYYRPVLGGAWTATCKSAAFAVTP